LIKKGLDIIRALPSFLTVVVMTVPILCVFSFAMGVDGQLWQRLWATRIPALFTSSFLLVAIVTCTTLVLGGILAYLVERTDLPLRRWLKPLLVTPLITPCYIIAICYVNFFGINGLGEKFFYALGWEITLPAIYGFWGTVFVLTFGTYPYVYTIVSSSLHQLDPHLTEAARCLGVSRWARFCGLILPMLLPAFSAGAILVTMYVLSDYGVVSMLRYPTFVNAIYEQISGRYNYSTAAALSMVLIAVTVLLVLAQGMLTKKKYYASVHMRTKGIVLHRLGWLKIPSLFFVAGVLVFGLLLPIGILIFWFMQSLHLSALHRIWAMSWTELAHSGFNSIFISSLAATAAVVLALPLAYASVRRPESLVGRVYFFLSQSGIALPGVLIALGLSLIFSRTVPALNFSVFALFLAFLVHFFAQALQTSQAGLRQVSPKFEESARLLGFSPIRSFWLVTRPLFTPALMTAWILVFLSSMRELPASLLLRPAGFDPLTVKIWNAASEGFYEQAAAPALLVVILSLPLIFVIIKSQGKYTPSPESN